MSGRDPREEIAELREALAGERAKAAAFADLNHELRTLLSGIFGITELLLDTELSGEQRDYVKRLRTHCEALGELVNNVLDYSRAEAGKLKLETVDLDVRKVVEDVGELFSGRAHDGGLELVVAVGDDVPSALRGDPTRLRQVLVNLVGNAIKFTKQGEVVVSAALSEVSFEHAVLRFEVRDTGVGISPEGQARLFQPFSQVHEGTGGGYGGSGLGLALARRIVEAMEGTIGVESVEGEGSRFRFTTRLERRVGGTERGAIPRVDVAGRRVLVAAPNAAVRANLGDMISSLDVEQGAAENAEAALSMLRAAEAKGQPYDVALLDLGLPGAADLFLAIDTEPAHASLRIVLLSYPGQRLIEDESAPRIHGPQGTPTAGSNRMPRTVTHLAKPVRRARLLACLRTLLGSSVETVSSAPRHDAPPESRRVPHSTQGSPRSGRHDGAASTPTRPVGTGLRLGPSSISMGPQNGQNPSSARPSSGAAPTVPFNPPAAPAAAPRPVVIAPGEDRPLVLLVEDNAVNQRVGKSMLERRGYRVDVASDGHEAVAATARTAYAAVLMDCQMPRLDGYAATHDIRERDAGRVARLPIIAMTANAGPGARERCIAAGMDDYIAKPVTPESLDEVLSRWVPRESAPPPPAPMPRRRVSSPVIDLGMLQKLRASQRPEEPDIVAEVSAIFLHDAPARMQAIKDAVAAGDLGGASRAAHTLKGSAGHLGAKTLVALCARFEEKARGGGEFNAGFAAEAIEEELDRVCRAVTAAAPKPGV